jgi:hypothetical protein
VNQSSNIITLIRSSSSFLYAGELIVESNTAEVRHATVCPRFGASAVAVPPPGATAAVPLALGAAGRCARSACCAKQAGHPGFCSGPKAAGTTYVSRPRARRPDPAHFSHHHHYQYSSAAGSLDSEDVGAADTTAGDCSSDETAVTTHIPPSPHAGPVVVMLPRHPALPQGLHPVAHVPAGLRLAKVLTAYDLTSRRIIMPAEDVDYGVSNAAEIDLLTLAAVDESQGWQFPTLRAWTNVAGRRGYLLEELSDFLESRSAAEGDVLLVYRDAEATPPRLELRVEGGTSVGGRGGRVRLPTATDAALSFSDMPALLHPEGRHQGSRDSSRGGTPRSGANGAMLCQRTTTCTKAAGHQGFCSGHKGFKRRESPTGAAALARGHAFRQQGRAHRQARLKEHENAYEEEYSESDEDYTPVFFKRARRSEGPAAAPGDNDPLVSLLSFF